MISGLSFPAAVAFGVSFGWAGHPWILYIGIVFEYSFIPVSSQFFMLHYDGAPSVLQAIQVLPLVKAVHVFAVVPAHSTHLVIGELSWVEVAVGPFHLPLPFQETFFELSDVHTTVCIGVLSSAMLNSLVKISNVFLPWIVVLCPKAMRHSIDHCSIVTRAIWEFDNAVDWIINLFVWLFDCGVVGLIFVSIWLHGRLSVAVDAALELSALVRAAIVPHIK